MLLRPLGLLTMSRVYTAEYLNRFSTRFVSRFGAVFLMLIAMLSLASGAARKGFHDRVYAVLLVVFAGVWVSGLAIGIGERFSPRVKEWSRGLATARITARRNRAEIGLGFGVVVLAVLVGAFGPG